MIGRAGRDGKNATVTLIFHKHELAKRDTRIRSVVADGSCLRAEILRGLDSDEQSHVDSNNYCSYCRTTSNDPNGYFVVNKLRRTRASCCTWQKVPKENSKFS